MDEGFDPSQPDIQMDFLKYDLQIPSPTLYSDPGSYKGRLGRALLCMSTAEFGSLLPTSNNTDLYFLL
jgi:hypothetical protein